MTRKREKNICGMSSCQPWVTWDWEPITAYWRRLGYEPIRTNKGLEIDTGSGQVIRDYGSRIEIDGNPVPDALITQMVAAAKERGWRGIHFWGPEEFQQRAKLEALRQGWPPESITLECEKDRPPPVASATMPEHLRRRLGLPSDQSDDNPATIPTKENQRHAPAPQPRHA